MQAHGVRVMSMLSFKPGGVTQAYAARGPIAHRALEQFITEVYWTDLDILLLDLPPGTGDIAISVAHLLPTAEIIVVTTPQQAAAEVAIRAGTIAVHTKQRVAGVIENMAAFPCPCCGEPIDVFGSGGGAIVSEQLSMILNTAVPLLGRVPFDVRLREGGDKGEPLVISEPESPAATVLRTIAQGLASKRRGLVGKSLSLSPAGR
jgi:ATP-binding protein involved in chromosome partitioning